MTTNKQPSVFPKLFIGDASKAFIQYINRYNYNYTVNTVTTKEELLSFIEAYSNYKNYTLPVILSDISFFNKRDQSLLLKFIDDTNLNLILLASRDNILDTIVSRVKEFRKYYVNREGDRAGFINISKARDMINTDLLDIDESGSSYEDMLIMRNKYNPLLSYDDLLVKSYGSNDKRKLLSLLEYNTYE